MITCYRVTQKKYAATAFDGEGARLYGGRWNNKGSALVYTAGSLSLATLELLVHLESYQILRQRYCYLKVELAETLCVDLPPARLPPGWNVDPPLAATKQIGDEWIKVGASAALAVPSALIGSEANYLLNPHHPDFAKLTVHAPEDFVFDPRLVKTQSLVPGGGS